MLPAGTRCPASSSASVNSRSIRSKPCMRRLSQFIERRAGKHARPRGLFPYWYLREMARVDGTPKMVSERYLGTAAEIAAAVEGREAAALPERTRHLAFGNVAAAWGMLGELGVIAVIDQAAGPRPAGQPLSTGAYLALAALVCVRAASGGAERGEPVGA